MGKIIKRIIGMVLLVALLSTSMEQEVQAAKHIQWPYGTYKYNSKEFGTMNLFWQFGDGDNGYDNFVSIYDDGSNEKDGIQLAFKQTGGLLSNTYRSRNIYGDKKHYFTIKVRSKSLVLKEHYKMSGEKDDSYFKPNFKAVFKLKKRLPKDVG